jgi:hypothetical protein
LRRSTLNYPFSRVAGPGANVWRSAVPLERWFGLRTAHPANDAFLSVPNFEAALVSELEEGLKDHEKQALGRLLKRGVKLEIEVFVRTHGPNPVFDPQDELDVQVGVASADRVNLSEAPSAAAVNAILKGEVVHVLFQAGEASRFNHGPLYRLNPLAVARDRADELDLFLDLQAVKDAAAAVPPAVAAFLAEGELGPKQPVMIRAALRRLIHDEVSAGRLSAADAPERYRAAVAAQKILFFVSARGGVSESHDESLRKKYSFFGFDPANVATIEQDLVRGVTVDEEGNVSLVNEPWSADAAGHLYALRQAARPGAFRTYAGPHAAAPGDADAFGYFAARGGRVISIVRINDMDRHTTEIVNAKAISYALRMFEAGFVNAIEGVANPEGQKGGTGTTFNDPEVHILTETHENSFPLLARAFDAALHEYVEKNEGRYPAYNAMRQIADLNATRGALRDFGGRVVFVTRQKEIDGQTITYLGPDLPMGDLSLLGEHYRSRMFQFVDPRGRDLLIHDMKKVENLRLALRTLVWQLRDPHIVAAVEEVLGAPARPFAPAATVSPFYGAPAPEFE